jgi:addiction module RelB/DinJ family antitoxin
VIDVANTRSSGMHIRVNPDIKAKAEPILAAIGLSFSDVFNLTLKQICLQRKIPFELTAVQLTENGYPPELEAKLLAESNRLHSAVADSSVKPYRSTKEMFAMWDKEDAEAVD